MESFSFLKYLRGGVVAGAQRVPAVAAATTTIAASASACEDGGGGDGNDDDASFFDLEFAVPGNESAASDAEEEQVEFNFAVAAGEDVVAPGAAEAVAVDAPAAEAETEAEAAVVPPPATLLRPATRFRVLLLKLRKPKASMTVDGAGATQAPRQPAASRFLIKFWVEDAPLASSRATIACAPRPPWACTRTSLSRRAQPLLPYHRLHLAMRMLCAAVAHTRRLIHQLRRHHVAVVRRLCCRHTLCPRLNHIHVDDHVSF